MEVKKSGHCAFLQKQAKEADNGVIFPTTSHPFVPKNLSIGQGKTLSGGRTSHRMNCIIVQP
jgi:hypothetical protein